MKKSLLLFTAILTALLLTPAVYAADIRLSSRCALTDAIIAANNDRAEGSCPAGRGADTITLTKDITLDSGLPKITSNIAIEGNGYTISGGNRYRIFYNDGGALTIKDLTMTKGYVESELIRNEDGTLKASTANSIGGAIYNANGTVSISRSIFSDNSTESDGGAVYNEGELSISGSSFSRNSADKDGGAIYNNGELSISDSNFSRNSAGDGGAIANWEELSISDSAFSRNSADDGGAIVNASELSIISSVFSYNSRGAIANWGSGSISVSSFSHNSAIFGGAIYNNGELSISDSNFSRNSADQGGAINNVGELTLRNSTFSGNSASSDWYVSQGGAIDNGGKLRKSSIISNSTFSGNSADKGGAIFNSGGGELSMVNSIIAGRGGNACYSESRLIHNISNFIQDGSCSPALRGDPMLGELVVPDDGSPAYFPLLASSPAIDAAYDDLCPETDQIGTERPQGTGCDIGAIEYTAP